MPAVKTLKKGDGLYGVKNWPDKAPDKSKTWCVVNLETGDINGRWHATRAQALDQAKAMYASMGNKARYKMNEGTYLVPLRFSESSTVNSDIVWLEAIKIKNYHTPAYGIVPVTKDKLTRFVDNLKKNVRGIDIATDFNHGLDRAKGDMASGWIKDAKVEGDSLLLGVNFTETAKKEIKEGAWKYFSLDWVDTYTHDDGTTHNDVIMGGGLTNRPMAKGQMPINFSEVLTPTVTENENGTVTLEYDATIENVNPAEFMEPGTGNVEFDKGRHDDSDPNRIETPPAGEDGSVPDRSQTVENKLTEGGEMDDFEKGLRDSLKLGDDVDVTKYITDGLSELASLKDTAKQFSEHKLFAEQYPEEHKRMVELEDANRTLQAKQFSEGLAARRVTTPGANETDSAIETNLGLSGLALEAATELHKKFSEGTATLADFTGFVDGLFNGGVTEYGERGTTQGNPVDNDVPTNVVDIRKKFSEKIDALKGEESFKDKTFPELVAIAAERNPELYNAYRTSNATA